MRHLINPNNIIRYCAILLLLCIAPSQAEPLKLIIPPIEKSAEAQVMYFYKLLELVLTKTAATDGPFSIEFYRDPISLERGLAELKSGHSINLVWATSNQRREEDLLPVRISLLRELNNYRLLLIRDGEQEKFDRINSLDDLRQLRAGLGSQWPEVDILRANNLTVVTSLNYDSLFKMLAAKRFDYFPRGLYEVWNEAELHKDIGLSIEKKLMIYYEMPFYFFVNKHDTKLANRLERGLHMALADGSFDKLFMSVPNFKRGTEEQLNSQRKLFRIPSYPSGN